MLALIGLFETFIASDDRFGTDAALCWRATGRAARGAAVEDCDLLCFGDSMVKFGVLPRVLDAGRDGRSYNLALHAGPPAASLALLRRALDHGARPHAVLVDFMPHHLAANAHDPKLDRPWAEMADWGELIELTRTARRPEAFPALALAAVLPSFRARHEVRAEAVALCRGRTWTLRFWFDVLERNWAVNRGAQPLPRDDGAAPLHIEEAARDPGLFPQNAAYDAASLGPVRRFLGLAAARGLTVYWLLPPLHPAVQNLRDKTGLDGAYERLVRRAAARHPHVIVLDARRSGYPAARFRDAVHLDAQGGAALSAELAALIASGRSAGRWRLVPLYRDAPPPTHLVEDVEQSRLALLQGRSSRVSR